MRVLVEWTAAPATLGFVRRKVERDVALAVLAISLGMLVGPACSSSNDSPNISASGSAAGSAPTSAPAGRVLAVAGAVTVAGKQLANGDSVGADDVIDTGTDGSITIELAHNLARWELGPGKHVRVRESLAWKEPKRSEPVASVEQDSVAAGRPAERSAATTVASNSETDKETDKATKTAADAKSKAAVKDKFDKIMGEGGGLGGVLEGDPNARGSGGGDWGSGGLGMKGTGPGGGGTGRSGGGTGEGTIGIGTIGTGTGSGYGTNGGPRRGSKTTPTLRPGTANVMGALPPEVIRRIVRSRFSALRFCYEKGLKVNPTLAGRLTVKFVISKEGEVVSAHDAGSTLSDVTTVSCMVAVFKALKFPKPQGGGIVVVSYPIVFDPAP